MLKFLFYLFIFYIIYSWIKLLFVPKKQPQNNSTQQSDAKEKRNFFQRKRKIMEDELSEYVDYEEIK